MLNMFVATCRGHSCDSGPWQVTESLGKEKAAYSCISIPAVVWRMTVTARSPFRAGFKGMEEVTPRHSIEA